MAFAPDPHYHILFQFQPVQGESRTLVEIRRQGLPADAPKAQVYHWLWLDPQGVQPLQFVRMEATPPLREFTQGLLRWDAPHALWQGADGRALALQRVATPELAPWAHAQLLAYLRSL